MVPPLWRGRRRRAHPPICPRGHSMSGVWPAQLRHGEPIDTQLAHGRALRLACRREHEAMARLDLVNVGKTLKGRDGASVASAFVPPLPALAGRRPDAAFAIE